MEYLTGFYYKKAILLEQEVRRLSGELASLVEAVGAEADIGSSGLTPNEILGLGENPTPDEIRTAHRKFVKQYHQDTFQGLSPEEVAKRTNEFKRYQAAYEILNDPTSDTAKSYKKARSNWERVTKAKSAGKSANTTAGTSQTSSAGASKAPGSGTSQTAGSGASQTSGTGRSQTAGSGARQASGAGASKAPGAGASQTSSAGASQTSSAGASKAPGAGGQQSGFNASQWAENQRAQERANPRAGSAAGRRASSTASAQPSSAKPTGPGVMGTARQQFSTPVANYPKEIAKTAGHAVKGMFSIPGVVGLGAAYATGEGLEAAADATGIEALKNRYVKAPAEFAVGAAADTAVRSMIPQGIKNATARQVGRGVGQLASRAGLRALGTVAGGAALIPLTAMAAYDVGQAISGIEVDEKGTTVSDVMGKAAYDNSGGLVRGIVNKMVGNEWNASSANLNEKPKGTPGGDPALKAKYAEEDEEEKKRLAELEAVLGPSQD